MPKIKLFAAVAFLAFACAAFLFPSGKTQAQSNDKSEKQDVILKEVMFYKLWKEVQKPEKKAEEVLTISDSSIAG